MTDEPTPPGQPVPSGALDKIKEVIGEINLPKLIAGPAGDAISRLIAGGADIPAAWLEQKAKAIRNKTEAQSQVAKTLADAASELVKNDPALVQRAADAFLAKELRHQHNRETIAIKAIEHLKEAPEAETTKPDDDWLNMYARHAQEASSDRMQDMWSKILAGQLRKPNAFSLQTLRFVSELDEATALLFEKWSPSVVNDEMIAFPKKQGDEFTELLSLEDYGLITGVTGNLSKMISENPDIPAEQKIMNLPFIFKDHVLIAQMNRPVSLTIPNVMLTRIGREVFSITKTPGTLNPIQSFAAEFPKSNVERITVVSKKPPPGEHPTVLWIKPPSKA